MLNFDCDLLVIYVLQEVLYVVDIIIIIVFFFFFFQAEDGIRDWSVTGVQTCALPISEASNKCGSKKDRHTWLLCKRFLEYVLKAPQQLFTNTWILTVARVGAAVEMAPTEIIANLD